MPCGVEGERSNPCKILLSCSEIDNAAAAIHIYTAYTITFLLSIYFDYITLEQTITMLRHELW